MSEITKMLVNICIYKPDFFHNGDYIKYSIICNTISVSGGVCLSAACNCEAHKNDASMFNYGSIENGKLYASLFK